MTLYFLMTALFVIMAILGALDAALASYNLLPWFNGLRWVRVHLITLGAMTEALFGLLPLLVAIRHNLPKPRFRWDIWLTLNIGLLTLLIGIPIIQPPLIFTGGTLIFVATVLLIWQLKQMKPVPSNDTETSNAASGRNFYIAGLTFLLLGIIIGTGLWLQWSDFLQIKVPIEVHIHANNWGFMSLVFAGLLIDLYPKWAKRPFANSQTITRIFWLMTLGALGLVLGPWFQSLYYTVPGLVMHLTATIWLLVEVIKPLRGDKEAWSTPGFWHLTTAYVWLLAPVAIAPLILLSVPGFPGAGIEQNAPQALIYGWVFQFGFALLPYFFRRAFQPTSEPALGGNWFSLVTVHLGGVFLWASIFIASLQTVLHGTAYLLWAAAVVPIAKDLWQIASSGLSRLEEEVVVKGATGD
ncbi:MAG: hypothetical protein DWQ04_24075 [Chloroflexi bacterium]|nr:MAG: hypothetical protein DWQ04_24075 [Chloroflexota bacterium]